MKELIRIAGTDIKGQKRIDIGLSKIYGVSYSLSNAICNKLNLDRSKKIGELNDEEVKKIEELLKNPENQLPSFLFNRKNDPDTGKDTHIISSTLKLRNEFDVRLMKKIKSYRGVRHAQGQPVRGQRTKSHFRTGATVGVMKKAARAAAKPAEEKKK